MDFSQHLSGKGVVITGAAGIFGHWLAEGFVKAGARLCLTDRDTTSLEALLAEIGAPEGSFAVAADVTRDEEINALCQRIAEAWGAPDVLVNNAGVYPSGFLLDIEPAEWDRIMGVNLRAPFVLTRAVAKLMIAAKRQGAIVNISSGASRKMRRTVVPYCVSKTALDRLTKGFAIELAEFGIRVNAVEPGFAPGSTASPLTEAHVSNVLAQIPLGRASRPEDASAAVMFLCSSAASYITGATLSVDGGNSIGSLAVFQDKKHPL